MCAWPTSGGLSCNVWQWTTALLLVASAMCAEGVWCAGSSIHFSSVDCWHFQDNQRLLLQMNFTEDLLPYLHTHSGTETERNENYSSLNHKWNRDWYITFCWIGYSWPVNMTVPGALLCPHLSDGTEQVQDRVLNTGYGLGHCSWLSFLFAQQEGFHQFNWASLWTPFPLR